jgi:hypothetical protein
MNRALITANRYQLLPTLEGDLPAYTPALPSASKPGAYAGDELQVARGLALVAGVVGRAAKLLLPVDPDVGGKLGADLVAQAQPEV